MRRFRTVMVFVIALLVMGVAIAGAQDKPPFKIDKDKLPFTPVGLPWWIYIPHYDCSIEWWTGIVIHNINSSANQYTVWYLDNNGYPVGYSEGALTALQKWVHVVTTADTGGVTQGFIFIESELPVIAFVNFGQNTATGVGITTLGPFISWCE